MKWNELKEGQKVVMQQDLVYLDADKAQEYAYMTRAEVNALITVAHPVGSELTFSYEGSFNTATLHGEEGDIGIVNLDEEIDPALYMPVIE